MPRVKASIVSMDDLLGEDTTPTERTSRLYHPTRTKDSDHPRYMSKPNARRAIDRLKRELDDLVTAARPFDDYSSERRAAAYAAVAEMVARLERLFQL